MKNNMQLNIKHSPKPTHRLRLTPQMKLNLRLLQMPLLKLNETVNLHLQENPLLNAEYPPSKSEREKSLDEYLLNADTAFDGAGLNYEEGGQKKKDYSQSLLRYPVTLSEHLLRQLRISTYTEGERRIGEFIIANVDDNGYLKDSIQDMAHSIKVTVRSARKVLSLIQTFDPLGIGACSVRECLLIQLKSKPACSRLTYLIVDTYLPHLEKKRYAYIAKNLKAPLSAVKDAVKEIARLEPKPGRIFSAETTVYVIPEASIQGSSGKYTTTLNASNLPRLTLNKKYKRMIAQENTPEDARRYLRSRLDAARSLIAAVTQRQQTMQKVIGAVVELQKDFLDKGARGFKPMTLDEIARNSGKNKSTVSRAISNKYIQTPWGVMELRSLLSSKIRQTKGKDISSKVVKLKITELITREKKTKPLPDKKIVELLQRQGISVARRTVSKYRAQLKILPSQSRRE